MTASIVSGSNAVQTSENFGLWLRQQNISLVLSTYRANRLIFIGTNHLGQLKVQERLFDRPMGLFAKGQTLWMAGRSHLWRFDNLLSAGQSYDSADCLYVPAASFLTGEVNAHELVVDQNNSPLFVNTVFSCLAQLKTGCSFEPIWFPPFINALVPEDRCHLNGLALQNGLATWATACSSGNTPTSWRRQRVGGGVVIHIPTNEIVCRDLTMPHSPRWYNSRLWLLNSGTGELGWIESETFQPLCALPGFARGLSFSGNYALVGLSKLRSPVFTGLPLEERLNQSSTNNQGICGLRVVELSSGRVLHSLDLPGPIDELFDLAVLTNVREPRAFGLKDESIDCLVKLPERPSLIQIHPIRPSGHPHQGQSVERLGLPQPKQNQQTSKTTSIRYQKVYHLTQSTLAPYSALTFPPLAPGSKALQRVHGELFGISANANGEMVGLVIAECDEHQQAVMLSLMVSPQWRCQGIGTHLVAYLSQFLQQEFQDHLSVRYQAPLQSKSTMCRLLKQLNWQTPQKDFLLLKGQSAQLAQINWPERFPLPDGYSVVPFGPHYVDAAARLNAAPELIAAFSSQSFHPGVSLVLLFHNQLVGWLIADRTDMRSIRYSAFFVDPSHRRRGQSLYLLVSAFRRQHAVNIPIARAAVAVKSEAMLRLTKRHLHQHLSEMSWSMHSGIGL